MISIDLKVLVIGAISIFIIGACIGLTTMALMNIAKDADRHYKIEDEENQK